MHLGETRCGEGRVQSLSSLVLFRKMPGTLCAVLALGAFLQPNLPLHMTYQASNRIRVVSQMPQLSKMINEPHRLSTSDDDDDVCFRTAHDPCDVDATNAVPFDR